MDERTNPDTIPPPPPTFREALPGCVFLLIFFFALFFPAMWVTDPKFERIRYNDIPGVYEMRDGDKQIFLDLQERNYEQYTVESGRRKVISRGDWLGGPMKSGPPVVLLKGFVSPIPGITLRTNEITKTPECEMDRNWFGNPRLWISDDHYFVKRSD